jgi:hypothetical protein
MKARIIRWRVQVFQKCTCQQADFSKYQDLRLNSSSKWLAYGRQQTNSIKKYPICNLESDTLDFRTYLRHFKLFKKLPFAIRFNK